MTTNPKNFVMTRYADITSKIHAKTMLPFGDLTPAGMQGALESTALLEPNRVPRCWSSASLPRQVLLQTEVRVEHLVSSVSLEVES